MTKRFDGKVALVTGGASGLGRAIALRFAQEGARVLIAGTSREPRGGGTPTDTLIRDEVGGDAAFVKADVAEEAQVAAMVAEAVDRYGSLDLLVNSAGITPNIKPSIEYDAEEWGRVIQVNLVGLWFCCQAAIRRMLQQEGRGRIINISSRKGLIGGGEGRSAYCASKGGVTNLTRQLAVEYGPEGINVNAICPGFIPVPGNDIARRPGHLDAVRASIPFNRLGEAEDIAGAAAFLASDDAGFVNGHNLVVDGGALVSG